MSGVILSEQDEVKLGRFASVLIPATAALPAAGDLPGFTRTLRVAVKACGVADPELRAAVDAVPAHADWAAAQALGEREPLRFRLAGMLASAAYFMLPEVLDALGFPADRQQPAGVEDFVEEYETGIVEPVMAAGPRYRVVD